jgi:mono/diheme cytochrome c family protein
VNLRVPWLGRCLLVLAAIAGAGCGDMQKQRNLRAYAPSNFFADGASARTPPAHTVESGSPRRGGGLRQAQAKLNELHPTIEMLRRGRDQFNAQCAPCHGEDGYGRGIVVRRGFPAPASLHDSRLRAVSDGHLYDVITQGFGTMYPAGYRIAPADRWAIVAYVRALQLSQHAALTDVPAAERAQLLRQ